MIQIPHNKKLSPGPMVRRPIGGIHTPLLTGNVLTKPVSTVLFKPVEKPNYLFN